MKIKNTISSGILLLILGCSSNSAYKVAHEFYMKDNYAAAIENYDRFIRRSDNGAEITLAELERSDCYLQLSLQAKGKSNTLLASRLLYLANSDIADSYLDNVYFDLAENTLSNGNVGKTLEYYNTILTHFPNSELIPQVLNKEIQLYIDQKEYESALGDYRILFDKFPDNEYRRKSEIIINPILPLFISEIDRTFDSGMHEIALNKYLGLYRLPSLYKSSLSEKISKIYWIMAQNHVDNNPEIANLYFGNVVKYNSERKQEVKERYNGICSAYMQQGRELILDNDLDGAECKFRSCFVFLEDYHPANMGLQELDELRNRNANANNFLNKAKKAEADKDIIAALKHYRKAYGYVETTETSDKIFLLSNQLKADKDSKGFAMQIIRNYRNGRLLRKLGQIEQKMKDTYGEEVVRVSGWKVFFSSGKYKQEVRYDILSSDVTHYYIWQVDLLKQKISPLNKESEKMMD